MTLLTSLTELIKLAGEATPGPWTYKYAGDGVNEVLAPTGDAICCDTTYYPQAVAPENQAFIASAKNLIERHAEELIKAVELWETPRMGDETP